MKKGLTIPLDSEERALLRFMAVPIPDRMKHLPIDARRGFVIPAFVKWVNGEPEFRAMDMQHFLRCMKDKLCWVCGGPLKRYANNPFVIGPMCTVNRISSEPPSHVDCARYSVMVCPFLSRPHMERRTDEALEAMIKPGPGVMLRRNPGVIALWFAREYMDFNVERGVLFSMGKPAAVEWYTEGRKASRAEVEESYNAGVPAILEAAAQDGPEEVAVVRLKIEQSRRYFPRR